MRRIVQIGTGTHSWICFKNNDIFLGCEPMLTQMQTAGIFKPPPDTVQSYIEETVICSKTHIKENKSEMGTVRYCIPKDNKTFEKGFLVDRSTEDLSDYLNLEKPCLTLDELLKKYEAKGFTESIYFLNINTLPDITNDIFSEYSWIVKPEIIASVLANDTTVDILKKNGYNVLKRNNPFIAIR